MKGHDLPYKFMNNLILSQTTQIIDWEIIIIIINSNSNNEWVFTYEMHGCDICNDFKCSSGHFLRL